MKKLYLVRHGTGLKSDRVQTCCTVHVVDCGTFQEPPSRFAAAGHDAPNFCSSVQGSLKCAPHMYTYNIQWSILNRRSDFAFTLPSKPRFTYTIPEVLIGIHRSFVLSR